MRSIVTFFIAVFFLLSSSAQAARIGYVGDEIYVPLRAGPASSYRIVHSGLKTGTQLEILAYDLEKGYSLVKTPSGLEGYIENQYLVEEPVAKIQLEELQSDMSSLTAEKTRLEKLITDYKNEHQDILSLNDQLKKEKQTIQKRLQTLETMTKNTQQIVARNKTLSNTHTQLTEQINILQAENSELSQMAYLKWFLYGAGTMILGITLGLVLPRIRLRRKQSEWL
ncbi:TIGR04211 family SH3 domain-containing protein [Zooshikella harenae]|uniref:TIGR04211 family SH3 domain-containing protein n=1 Tax=Zooshikella harenae TaxID=2827238 RepID=A0ABS5Z8K6_9GAMM|nr:TIGR04211 family SH3 domain-containing protein [Zooshikella harenae]MBU2710339.1 TIGR04211 family SH3 domain-containing protein [Zooshikella harenae]